MEMRKGRLGGFENMVRFHGLGTSSMILRTSYSWFNTERCQRSDMGSNPIVRSIVLAWYNGIMPGFQPVRCESESRRPHQIEVMI